MAEKKVETLTTKQVAEALGTTPKELRVFLRASEHYSNAGSGGRYAFAPKDVGPMKTHFTTWKKEREEARQAARVAAEPEVEDVADEAEDVETSAPARRARKTA
ncbi:hypothetical protein L1857_34570 [Amycolatopsis thermalba]|uniref:Uncharacterized protein n=1 Tax=Amycolatopsis thermalba TaxID=944492 RepID=A0ABY4P5G3_9PSEU|nr:MULTISPECIES: hypothetical protein [Amycolatopsis]UQS27559.1 hypothetical protein L1857_34570 [Amycolatopsis thermalba]